MIHRLKNIFDKGAEIASDIIIFQFWAIVVLGIYLSFLIKLFRPSEEADCERRRRSF